MPIETVHPVEVQIRAHEAIRAFGADRLLAVGTRVLVLQGDTLCPGFVLRADEHIEATIRVTAPGGCWAEDTFVLAEDGKALEPGEFRVLPADCIPIVAFAGSFNYPTHNLAHSEPQSGPATPRGVNETPPPPSPAESQAAANDPVTVPQTATT